MQNTRRISSLAPALAVALSLAAAPLVAPLAAQHAPPTDTVASATAVPRAVPLAVSRPMSAADSLPRTQPLFTKRDLWVLAGFAATTAALFPLDKELADRLEQPESNANEFIADWSTNVEVITSPGAYWIGAGLYVGGRAFRNPRIADLGLHGFSAVVLAETFTWLGKGVFGRTRPFAADSNPTSWKLAAGFTEGTSYRSFPSGHTSTAFAAAAAVTDEMGAWWPKQKWLIGAVMYGGATAVGLSRMYHSKHWASDVAMGAAIGVFSGRKIVQWAHANPGNVMDRVLLGTAVMPDGTGGAMRMVTVTLKP